MKYILPTSLILLLSFLFLVFISVFHVAYPINVTTTTRSSELSVVGEGKVDVVPDTAYIDVGITINNGATVEEVQKGINQINDKIVQSMKGLGIAKTDIKTSNYSISPNVIWENNTNKTAGYNGSVSISIKVHSPERASQVVEAATQAGANQVQGTRFVVDSPEKYREEARQKAIENAKEQAQKLAKELGIRLGKVTNIVESNGGVDLPYAGDVMMAKGLGMGGANGPEIEPGNQTLTSVVTLYFEKN